MNILKCIMTFALSSFLAVSSAQDLAPAQNQKGKWGFVDDSGNTVIDYKYDEADGFINGRAKVKKGDNYGYIDEKGKSIIPIKYQEITPFDAYSYRAATGGKVKDGILSDEKWGFIDLEGKPLLKCEYDEIGEFSANGIAYVEKDNKYGYINRRFEFVVPCKFTAVGSWNPDGRVWVCEGGKPDKSNANKILGGKIGIYDSKGQIVIPVKYSALGTFTFEPYSREILAEFSPVEKVYNANSLGHKRENKQPVITAKFSSTPRCGDLGYYYSTNANASKNGIADANGKELIKPGSYQIVWYPSENFALVVKGKNINYLNLTNGKLMAKKGYANAFSFNNGYAIIQETPSSGYKLIDKNFRDVTGQYNNILPYADQCYRVIDAKGMGLISYDGKMLIETGSNTIGESNFGRMKFRAGVNGKYGYIDNTGTLVIPAIYDECKDFEHGMAKVKEGDSWGIINTDGSQRLVAQWSALGDIVSPDQNEFWVGDPSDNLMHLYSNETASYPFSHGYFGARAFDIDAPGVAIITGQESGTIGCINRKGELVIPGEFSEISHVIEAYNLLSAKPEGTIWKPIDTYRIKLRHNPKLNKGKLSETLSSDLWDF